MSWQFEVSVSLYVLLKSALIPGKIIDIDCRRPIEYDEVEIHKAKNVYDIESI